VCIPDFASSDAYHSIIRSYSSASATRSAFSSFFPNVDSCAGDECALGGDAYCDSFGLTCGPIPDQPCIYCTSAHQPPLLPAALDLHAPHCTTHEDCAAKHLCVEGRCLTQAHIDLLPPFCGNARLDAGELCDEGFENSNESNALCRRDCTQGRCGDGILDTPLERCDDGNGVDGDGCSSLCLSERMAAESPFPGSMLDIPFQPGFGSGAAVPLPPSTSDTGPAAIAVMAAGAAAGWAWVRRRRRG